MTDLHVRRSGEDYGEAFLALLPQGPAWPRALGSTLDLVCRGLAYYWGDVDRRAADLLEQESDPRKTIELLPDWERNWGLPDPCYKEPQTIGERQLALIMRMTMHGAQSREFFIGVAAQIGYTITISEYRVFVCGIDRCGDNRVYGDGSNPMYNEWGNPILTGRGTPISEGELSPWPCYGLGPPGNRFYWTVHVDATKLVWFRCASGQCGVDPHLRIGTADDLECLLNRWKPAHTIIIFDYSEQQAPESEYFWFRASASYCGVDPHLLIRIPGTEPYKVTLTGDTVARTAPIGTVVGKLSVQNSYGPSFYLTEDAGGRFGISGTNLVTRLSLAADTMTSHVVRVGATIPMIPPYKRFTITVTGL